MSLQSNRKFTVNHGMCYVVSEWLYHRLGGKKAGWKPMVLDTGHKQKHWFLQHCSGFILDATANQFDHPLDYSKAKGCGFLTKKPSKRTQAFGITLD